MCFSASVSYSSAAVLVPAGLYAVYQARKLRQPYFLMALAPILFGIQQAFEGRVWQLMEAGDPAGAIPFAVGFHFFSHFLWPWWIPISSYLVEERPRRKRLFLGIGLFAFPLGGLIFLALLFNPDWMSVEVDRNSIDYKISSTWQPPFHLDIPIPDSVLYALIILTPLLGSSHRHIRIFGGLVVLSIVLTSAAYGYAFVSVWCFFAALLSLYLVAMIRRLSAAGEHGGQANGTFSSI